LRALSRYEEALTLKKKKKTNASTSPLSLQKHHSNFFFLLKVVRFVDETISSSGKNDTPYHDESGNTFIVIFERRSEETRRGLERRNARLPRAKPRRIEEDCYRRRSKPGFFRSNHPMNSAGVQTTGNSQSQIAAPRNGQTR